MTMPQWGVFARVFPRGTPGEVAGKIAGAGFTTTQLNLSVFGESTLPAPDSDIDLGQIGSEFAAHGVEIWGVSATFNAIHPDESVRRDSVLGAMRLIDGVALTGARFATVCTGSRDAQDMWRAHPDNGSRGAWRDLRETLDELIPAAARAGVRLGIEPESGNVVADATTARRLLDELGSDSEHVGIVLDPANLVTVDTLDRQDEILRHAFELLADHAVCVHAKDVVEIGASSAPGNGGLDYTTISALYAATGLTVPVILQDCTEQGASSALEYVASFWR